MGEGCDELNSDFREQNQNEITSRSKPSIIKLILIMKALLKMNIKF